MTSPLAVLSDAALYIQQMEKIEQMEQLNKLKVSRPNTLKVLSRTNQKQNTDDVIINDSL